MALHLTSHSYPLHGGNSAVVRMAGFGSTSNSGSTSKKKKNIKAKSPGLSAKKQWDKYKLLVSSNSHLSSEVYARDGSSEADEWALIGRVAFEKPASPEQAAFAQKRLILEHAARLYPRLSVKKAALECGLDKGTNDIAKIGKVEVPPDINCGFVGEPDPGGFYTKGNRVEKQLRSSGAAPMADSKGRLG
eukprot:CAMPEP_0119302822 /NCGR_PEP_ID=MMETSP1333-20130426/4358_1 /TAXON_ID=418940 /ORGANISM="Scyphosphaera apsteinii, Strain RCC1455" /LENGTH=189 /DNA_ID=CAMNT_0007305299 /DNA_START=106 /DNA_END=678 /DNA_ORIENTATION=-